MQFPLIVQIFIGVIYAFVAWLIFYQIELRIRLIGRLRCRFGKHKHVEKRLGVVSKQYRCVICGKAKEHPHLTVIDGGKKDLGSKFRW